MDERQHKILEAIIEAFIRTANPVGSKFLQEVYEFDVSSATIRNEMAALEEEGYLTHPHTSAGRVPTSLGYRLFVDRMSPDFQLLKQARQDFLSAHRHYYLEKTKEKLHEAVAVLAGTTESVSFATLPDKERVFYLGIANILKKPEFSNDPFKTTRIVEKLENDLYELLLSLDLNPEGTIYIGEENILPEFQSCSLLAVPYAYRGFKGVLGILGSTRMNYGYNRAALRVTLEFLNQEP